MLGNFTRQVETGHRSRFHHRQASARSKAARARSLAVEPLERRQLLNASPVISEFMAINDNGLQDFEGDRSDWLEIHNPATVAVDLAGWKLRDGGTEWVFPAMSLGPGEFRVIFASDKDLRDPAAELHTNFKLSGSGEYLGLLDDTGAVVHQYNEYPQQTADRSYGIAQDVEKTDFVASGASANYLVPPNGNQGAWTTIGYNDGGWDTGATALGFADTVPGFAVWNYKASGTVGNLSTAESVIDNPGLQASVWSENRGVINYFNSQGRGHYTANEVNFPGLVGEADDFVIEATGAVTIPSAGAWSFGVSSDDGFGLTITGATTTVVANSDTAAGSDTISYINPRGPGDTLGVYDFPQAGVYNLRLVFYERGGGAELELFAAQGSQTAFSGSFDLVGDTAGGGLEVFSEPVSGGGGGSGFSGLIETDVEGVMKDVNASMYVRIPFSVESPELVESLTLKMKYDDGYVAYLNGQEIARRNAPASPSWNSSATADRSDAMAGTWENVDVSAHLGLLGAANVLAIHGMNYTAANGDFLVLPELSEIRYLGLGEHFFETATPGDVNTEEYWLKAAATQFSHERGFYEEPFDVTITTDVEGAAIYYTTDGSAPTEAGGTRYTSPIRVATTTILRAAAFEAAYEPSDAVTQTYLFLDDVLNQPSNPAGFPTNWNGTTADYEMDPNIIGDPLYADTLKDDLMSLPTMSLVMDVDDVFGSGGIYANPTGQGTSWERPASLEYFDPNGSEEFQVNAGARMYGGVGRNAQYMKHSFRILFKSDYGPTKLRFPLFGDGAVDEFDTIILRSNFNDAWVWGGSATQFIRDEFIARLQNAMGDGGRHGDFVHLYINGLYWGLYNPVERPDTSFSASYYGGDKDNWDGINSGNPTGESQTTAWSTLMGMAGGLAANTEYQRVQGNNLDGSNNPAYEDYLDIDQYINFLLVNQFGGNNDWGSHNWYAGRMRGADSTGWKAYSWDAEWVVDMRSGLNDNTVNDTTSSNWLLKPYTYLRNNAEFRLRYADQVHKLFFNGGALTPEYTGALYASMAAGVEQAVKGETARWGDVRGREPPYDLDDWTNQRNYLLNTYLPQRSGIVLNQLKSANLYPNIVAPSFRINGSPQHGGGISLGDSLTITAPSGTIYYTLDGTDPRELYGAVSPGAEVYSGAITLNRGTHVTSRVYTGGQWSALNEATFYVDLAPNIRITEIMYNPADPTPDEQAQGFTDNERFEFIEIKNISAGQTMPLAGLRFSDGINFTFGDVSVVPGDYVLVVKDLLAFNYRYDAFAGTIAGEYTGSLRNSGEAIQLDSPIGGVIHEFDYGDGWYGHTDGEGFSLTIRDPEGAREQWDLKEGWRASATLGGSPGYDDTLVDPASVVITEVLAHSDAPFVDTIELHNVSSSAVDVGGWFLSDQKTDDLGNEVLTKYEIPTPSIIGPGQYLVLREDTHFGAAFGISELGDDVYLSSNANGVAGGYREHVDFGASPRNVSIGLYTKSTGGTDFTLLSDHTFGTDNAYPYLEDLVINEMMYHPAPPSADEIAAGFDDDEQFEFVEIYNTSATTSYTLSHYYVGNGIGFTFGWTAADDFGNESWTLEPGATATWDATLPAGPDSYEVFARWDLLDAEGQPRDLDGQARYRITHDGGQDVVVRDQDPEIDDEGPGYMDPEGWVSLGTYSFSGSGRVVLTRGTDSPQDWTIADQVKFVSTGYEQVVDNPTLDSWYAANGPAEIGPGGYVVIVRDFAAFDERYDVAGGSIPVAGQYSGQLANNGEKVKLFRFGDPEPNGYIPNYRIDYVNYGDSPPWPMEADGPGSALNRVVADEYGNDAGNWAPSSANGTPGELNNYIDPSPPSVPGNLTAAVTVGPDTVSLSWDPSVDPQTFVDHYVIYRDDELLGTSPTAAYDDTDVQPAVFHSYQVSAVNRDGYQSALTVPLEVAVPGIVSYAVPDTSHIEITFTEPLDPATAEVPDNYVFTGGTLANVSLQPGGLTVVLTTNQEMLVANPYSVTVNNVTTISGNEMPGDLQIAFSYEPRGAGFILREYWTNITGTAVSDLTNNPNYPDNPSGDDYPTIFEGPVDWAEYYGTRIHGYVHPPVSGNYTFWVSSDDNSALYLSTDANPANASLIASVPGWTNYREWNRYAQQQSAPIMLLAGQKYYISALQKEQGGGDSISVRWQLPDGSWEDPAVPIASIPGIRLSPYTSDILPPTADVIDIDPDPRLTPVDQINIVFSEAVTGFDVGDLSLTRDGGDNLLTGNHTLNSANGVTWRISGLADVTAAAGTYTLLVRATGAGIRDAVGNLMIAGASDLWTNNLSGPTPDIIDVTPDPRNSAVEQIQIVFSEAVTGFDLGDLSLVRDGGGNLLTGTETLTSPDDVTWTLGGLGGLTDVDGNYLLMLIAAGSGIQNSQNEPMTIGAADNWATDLTPPQADLLDVDPDPRFASVDEIDVVFSEPVSGLDLSDFSFTRDGGENLLGAAQSLSTDDGLTWTLGGLLGLTGSGSTGFVAFNDHVVGNGTHAWATSFAENGTPSGFLKDIETGINTEITLTTSQSGIRYRSSQGLPAAGTDAYNLFNGFVDFDAGAGASVQLEASNNDYYTHTFSGLGAIARYNFHGTAVRGNSNYTNRWTKVTLVGADSATADHSNGSGLIVISNTEIALWTGDNGSPSQGYVAGWLDIDPGADGQFAVMSQQYTGTVPTTIHPSGTADGTKGYAISGIRLEQVPRSGLPGVYNLTLSAAASGVEDDAANTLAADATEVFVIVPNVPDGQSPTAVIVDVTPDPRAAAVEAVEIVFDEPVAALDVGDLTLSRDGGGNLLTGGQTLTTNDNVTWTLGNLAGLSGPAGSYTLTLTAAGSGIQDAAGNPLQTDASDLWVVVPEGRVEGRHVFYNQSTFDGDNAGTGPEDDDAIAADKQALLPGETATLANYTSYTRGINGIMVDMAGLPPGALTADDFTFKMGNSFTPGAWGPAPDPALVTVRPGAGVNGSSRVTLVWPNNAVEKQWLQVTVLAGARTGLSQPDVFYFGNAIGESGNSAGPFPEQYAKVNVFDMLGARDNQRNFLNPAPIDFAYDFNRDAQVDASDMLIARNNQTHFLNALRLITVPGGKAAGEQASAMGHPAPQDAVFRQAVQREPERPAAASSKLDWLVEFDQMSTQRQPPRKDQSAEAAADAVLAMKLL